MTSLEALVFLEIITEWTTSKFQKFPLDVDLIYCTSFRDLTCNEVEGCWIGILAFSIVLNILGCLFTLMYLCLVMCFRVSPDRYNYTSVQTNVNVR